MGLEGTQRECRVPNVDSASRSSNRELEGASALEEQLSGLVSYVLQALRVREASGQLEAR